MKAVVVAVVGGIGCIVRTHIAGTIVVDADAGAVLDKNEVVVVVVDIVAVVDVVDVVVVAADKDIVVVVHVSVVAHF